MSTPVSWRGATETPTTKATWTPPSYAVSSKQAPRAWCSLRPSSRGIILGVPHMYTVYTRPFTSAYTYILSLSIKHLKILTIQSPLPPRRHKSQRERNPLRPVYHDRLLRRADLLRPGADQRRRKDGNLRGQHPAPDHQRRRWHSRRGSRRNRPICPVRVARRGRRRERRPVRLDFAGH